MSYLYYNPAVLIFQKAIESLGFPLVQKQWLIWRPVSFDLMLVFICLHFWVSFITLLNKNGANKIVLFRIIILCICIVTGEK